MSPRQDDEVAAEGRPGDDHRADQAKLEARLGYEFDEGSLLERALTHRSYRTENEAVEEDYQRLEFLGDAVLGLAIADVLFRKDREVDEGVLSRRQSQLVRRSTLARVARELDLGAFLRLGKGEVLSGGRDRGSLLADTYEAVLGAIYLDGGFDAAREVVLELQSDVVEEAVRKRGPTDYKSMLQELTQRERNIQPSYSIVEDRGPAHDKTFVAEVRVDGEKYGVGEGRSKQRAEQRAASEAVDALSEEVSEGDLYEEP